MIQSNKGGKFRLHLYFHCIAGAYRDNHPLCGSALFLCQGMFPRAGHCLPVILVIENYIGAIFKSICICLRGNTPSTDTTPLFIYDGPLHMSDT
jgi:hypothetical protein